MIIVNIIGGLGNQMFQYACGRALSLKLQTNLKINNREFSNYQLHQGFELDRLFNCPVEIATDIDLKDLLGWQRSRLLRRVLRFPLFNRLRIRNFILEPHFNYWKEINLLKESFYIDGYWQSENYFNEFAEKIREDFAFKAPFSDLNSQVAAQISDVNAVSLHVRRGDYVTNSKNSFMNTLNLGYYKKSIDYFKQRLKNPIFFVFSDDIGWVKSNLLLDKESIFVDHNRGNESYNDMRLMSLCNHHIIANSSFSWWGAWLNPRPDKIVIAPQNWFASGGLDQSDIIPKSWLKMS